MEAAIPGYQPGDLGGPRQKPSDLEEDSENRSSNRGIQPDRHRKGQKSGTKVNSVQDQHCKCPSPSNMPALSTHLPHANRPVRTYSDAMHQISHNSKFCQPSFGPPTLNPGINSITPTIIEITSQYSSSGTPTTAAAVTTIGDGDSLLNCPHWDRTFTSRIGLDGHLRIHRTETGELVPGAPTHSRDYRIHCPHAFPHKIGLIGHMRIHDSGNLHYADNTDTPCTPSAPATLTPTTTNDTPSAPPNCSYPHRTRKFNSRIGLVGYLRIHRTEAGEPVPGAPTYSRRAPLHCPHCSRPFTHHMGLLGHMRLHDNLR
ncbi:unnamed protein product [Schistocephalus solidus]|uniref:C2H2-type domain-containing protein n=1 Tax=Schistocephalus solidus TaxID=70667 RepID=A0A183T7N4_SCHSO|nr:unnamed protein product [Schistocephalus solidus]